MSRIDHFFLPLVDPEAAFGLLTGALGIPIAWPFRSFEGFSSGGVNLGNANLELLSGQGAFFEPKSPARIQGIAFDCGSIDDQLIHELERRGIGHGPILPFAVDGQVRWTNLLFTGVRDDHTMIFACDYVDPTKRDLVGRARALADKQGGRLGAVEVSEVVVGSDDIGNESVRWAKLLGPASDREQSRWTFRAGPTLRIDAGQEPTISLVIAVRSAVVANQVLAGVDMSPLEGFRFRIFETPPQA